MNLITKRKALMSPQTYQHPMVSGEFCYKKDVQLFCDAVSAIFDGYEEEIRQHMVRGESERHRCNRLDKTMDRMTTLASIAQGRMIEAENTIKEVNRRYERLSEELRTMVQRYETLKNMNAATMAAAASVEAHI